MATLRPRIAFTPDEATYAAIQRVAKSSGRAGSAVVTDCMEMMMPHLQNLAEVLEQARSLTDESRAVMLMAAEQAAEQMRPAVIEARRIVAQLGRELEDVIAGAEPPLPFGSEKPPTSNTGVTVHIRGDEQAR